MLTIRSRAILPFCILGILFFCEVVVAQKTSSLEKELVKLDKRIVSLLNKINVLEARISAMEVSGSSFPSNKQLRLGMIEANEAALINDMNNLAADAYSYRIRPASFGGGKGSYIGYTIPRKLTHNVNGDYDAVVQSDSVVIFTGTSTQKLGSVKAILNKEGWLGSFEYTGEFE